MKKTVSIDRAAKVLGVSRTRVESLVEMGRLEVAEGTRPKPYVEGVEMLLRRRKNREYVSLKSNVDFSRPFGIAVQVSSPELGGSMFLAEENGRDEAIEGLREIGVDVPGSKDLEVTGWWPVLDEDADLAVESGAVILGVTGGFVFQAGQAVAWYQGPFDSRKAFAVRPIEGEELEKYLGYIEKTGQMTTYVQL